MDVPPTNLTLLFKSYVAGPEQGSVNRRRKNIYWKNVLKLSYYGLKGIKHVNLMWINKKKKKKNVLKNQNKKLEKPSILRYIY